MKPLTKAERKKYMAHIVRSGHRLWVEGLKETERRRLKRKARTTLD